MAKEGPPAALSHHVTVITSDGTAIGSSVGHYRLSIRPVEGEEKVYSSLLQEIDNGVETRG